MISFESDYNNGCHPLILQRLMETNNEAATGYGLDQFCDNARRKIAQAFNDAMTPGCIHFLPGGTQVNATVIDALLQSYEAVIAVETGHIAVHEAGAIEASGHKVITLPSHEGKMLAEDLWNYMGQFTGDPTRDHMVQPRLVYITFPTELGTLYTLHDLMDIKAVCDNFSLMLYIDGARLPYGLMSPQCDIPIQNFPILCDAFTLGGTKCGAMLGEALVMRRTPKHFFTIAKQHGAILAKGRMLGVQFDVLMTDNLYFDLAHQADLLALQLRDVFVSKGYTMSVDSPTNQQFVILPSDVIKRLSRDFIFEQWNPVDDNHVNCRFVTSWATTPDHIASLQSTL